MKIKALIPMPVRNFYELYKYGEFRLDRESCTTFDQYDAYGYPEVDHTQFMGRIPCFDSDDQGIILECEIDKDDFESAEFNISGIIRSNSLKLKCLSVAPVPLILQINDVVKIYPLSENALRFLPGKIGEDIALEKPVFQNLFEQAAVRGEEARRKKGVMALFEMSGLDMPDGRELLDIFLTQAEKFKSTYRRPDKQERFLLHALVYERREAFPKSDIGILFDLCKILADKEEAPSYRKTRFYKKLDTLKSEYDRAGIVEVLQYFEREPHYEKVRKMATYAECQHKDYITAALFTKYKELLREENYKPIEMTKEIRDISRIFPEEAKVALYLIGAFFSYKRFHNDLYVSKRLRILKESRVAPEPGTKPEELPTRPQGVSGSEAVVSEESKTCSLEKVEKPFDEADPDTRSELFPSDEIPSGNIPGISNQSNEEIASAQSSLPKNEETEDISSLEVRMPMGDPSRTLFDTHDQEMSQKKKGTMKTRRSKKPEDHDKQSHN